MSSKNRRNRNRSGRNPNANRGGEQSGKQNNRSRRKEPKIDPVEFWGDPEALPEPLSHVQPAPDVRALVSSLGRPPITGQETAAEHWFSLVYERAAVLSGALAAAGGLHEADDEDTDGE